MSRSAGPFESHKNLLGIGALSDVGSDPSLFHSFVPVRKSARTTPNRVGVWKDSGRRTLRLRTYPKVPPWTRDTHVESYSHSFRQAFHNIG